MMHYYSIPEILKPYVEAIWSFESPERLDVKEQAVVIPSGRCILLWNYKGIYAHRMQNHVYEHALYDLHLVGQHMDKIVLSGTAPVNAIGISFKPYGFYALVGGALADFTNKVTSISKVNKAGKELLKGFQGSVSDALDALTTLLIERIHYHPDERVVQLIDKIDACKGMLLIQDLFKEVVGSQRHLNKLFKAQVGITPKEYTSIIRFQEVYNRFVRSKNKTGKNELYDFYYDESHFIQNFKKMLTKKPNLFMKATNDLGDAFIKK